MLRGKGLGAGELSLDVSDLNIEQTGWLKGVLAGIASTRLFNYGVQFFDLVKDGFVASSKFAWILSTAVIIVYLPISRSINEENRILMEHPSFRGQGPK